MIELLNNFVAAITFRPEEGPFRTALLATVLEKADAGQLELFSADNCDIQVTVSSQTLEAKIISFLIISDMGEQSLEVRFASFSEAEKTDFRQQFTSHAAEQKPAVSGSANIIVRKASSGGMYTQEQAAERLGCSAENLKNKIPCTDYSYDEIDGKKFLREYYWSQPLIDRLQQIKASGAKPEDITYVATECCFGDSAWAEELLASLRPRSETPKTNTNKKNFHRYAPRKGQNQGQSRTK